MAWERTYNKPTINGQPHTVSVNKPFGYKKDPSTATQSGPPPGESYEIKYVWDGTTAAKSSDVWNIAYAYNDRAVEREITLVLKVGSGGGTLGSTASDKPKVRDGYGSGDESGTIVVHIGDLRISGIIAKGSVYKLPSGPTGKKTKKTKKKAPVTKKSKRSK